MTPLFSFLATAGLSVGGTVSSASIHLGLIDYLILAIYIIVVVGVGFALRGNIRNATDFFLSGRSIRSG